MTEKDFIKKWTEKINNGIFKKFPDEFARETDYDLIKLPGKTLIIGSEIFGSFEVTDTKGNPFFQSDSQQKVKYVLYANRSLPAEVKLPKDESAAAAAVKQYEKFLDSILIQIQEDFKKELPESKSFINVSNQIFNNLNLQRY